MLKVDRQEMLTGSRLKGKSKQDPRTHEHFSLGHKGWCWEKRMREGEKVCPP